MSRYWVVAGFVLAVFLALFLVGEALGLQTLLGSDQWTQGRQTAAAFVGVGLLTADVVIPVPSSLVMTVHGALFGPWWGTLLSLVGALGSALIGFGIGRASNRWLAKVVSPAEREKADRLLRRWGLLAIVATRPLPMLAETVMVLAGASPLPWWRAGLAALAGSLPAALVYALVGASGANAGMTTVALVGALLIAGAAWLVGRRLKDGIHLELCLLLC